MSDSTLDLERIRLELRQQERSQAWLGRQVGVRDSSLFNRYLRGRQRRPIGFIQRIANVLGVPESELLLSEKPAA